MVTKDELELLISDCPTLYHMAERGSWESIKTSGLLSTTALLDKYEVSGKQRDAIESAHRPVSVEVLHDTLPRAVVRDQIPMSDSGLRRCLPEYIEPSDWYRLLNSKVFFWLSKERLHKLTGAKSYRELEHDVLEVDTRSLIEKHFDRIWLCPINSGCTKPFPHPRDERIFTQIEEYDYSGWRKKRKSCEVAVELAVEYAVHDIRNHVKRVVVMKGTEVLSVIE